MDAESEKKAPHLGKRPHDDEADDASRPAKRPRTPAQPQPLVGQYSPQQLSYQPSELDERPMFQSGEVVFLVSLLNFKELTKAYPGHGIPRFANQRRFIYASAVVVVPTTTDGSSLRSTGYQYPFPREQLGAFSTQLYESDTKRGLDRSSHLAFYHSYVLVTKVRPIKDMHPKFDASAAGFGQYDPALVDPTVPATLTEKKQGKDWVFNVTPGRPYTLRELFDRRDSVAAVWHQTLAKTDDAAGTGEQKAYKITKQKQKKK
jgi:hypothetical protein